APSGGGVPAAEYTALGYNYRMTDIQGALGSAQMDRAPEILRRRVAHARAYDKQLGDASWLRIPQVPAGFEHGYQSYVCLFQPELPTLDNAERLHGRRN